MLPNSRLLRGTSGYIHATDTSITHGRSHKRCLSQLVKHGKIAELYKRRHSYAQGRGQSASILTSVACIHAGHSVWDEYMRTHNNATLCLRYRWRVHMPGHIYIRDRIRVYIYICTHTRALLWSRATTRNNLLNETTQQTRKRPE